MKKRSDDLMALQKRFFILSVVVTLGGCTFASDALFPSMRRDKAQEQKQPERVNIPESSAESASAPPVSGSAPPALGSSSFEPGDIPNVENSGTFVGKKIDTLRQDLSQLQETIRRRNTQLQNLRDRAAQDARHYHEIVAHINARIQVGTTPGNPKLRAKWQQAQEQLERIGKEVDTMNQLATQAASEAAMTAYLLDSIRAAYNISGAVEQDHRHLRILEDETDQTAILIERLLEELNTDISRQRQYINNEESRLNRQAMAIKDGQLVNVSPRAYGNLAGSRESAEKAPPFSAASPNNLPEADISGRRPLVKLRFDRSNVAYEQALYEAAKTALDRHPNVLFDVVSVTPSGPLENRRHSAQRKAEKVFRDMPGMGIPADRLKLGASTDSSIKANEVRVYVRRGD